MDGIGISVGGPECPVRHFPIRRTKASSTRRTRNYIIRAAAKRYSQSNGGVSPDAVALYYDPRSRVPAGGLPFHLAFPREVPSAAAAASGADQSARRALLERTLRQELPVPESVNPRRRRGGARSSWGPAHDDGVELAHSDVPLPSDHARLARCPTLEREDAFRDATTTKGTNIRLQRTVPYIGGDDEDSQVAELYRMGLLYDEKDQPETAFNLNSIQHDEPVYSIRPAKRARKQRKGKAADDDEALYLDLSFADLGADGAIAQYLLSPPPSQELNDTTSRHMEEADASGPDKDMEMDVDDDDDEQQHEDVPLRVIYELDSMEPSYDVDTTQLPDLITDTLSDYDCLSDSEGEESPSQREIYDSAANTHTDAWIMLGDGS